MSHPIHFTRLARAGSALALGIVLAATPAVATAQVDLGTAAPFVVLGGSTATNTGSSVLNGDLGVSPGTALPGFNVATVNGAVHANDAVAAQGKLALTNAYNVAAGQPTSQTLTGVDLGLAGVLQGGVYTYSTSAQLTGALTLDGAGNPNSVFIFQIGSQLTTASASSVVLINGASPCNVYWQVGTSATLGSSSSFVGTVMADQSISVNNSTTVQGRLLASIGAVTLDNNVIDGSMCGTSSTPPPVTPTPPTGGTGTGVGTLPPASGTTVQTRIGTVTWKRETPRTSSRQPACADGFTATLRGRMIKRVVYRLDGRVVKGATKSPFRLFVRGLPGTHKVTARVTFKDATRAKTLTLRYRACAAVALRPTLGPSRFTG